MSVCVLDWTTFWWPFLFCCCAPKHIPKFRNAHANSSYTFCGVSSCGGAAKDQEKERERETERQRDRETERQRDRETERQGDGETER